MIPLYSSVYYDFFAPNVQNYVILRYSSWADAIAHAYIGAAAEDTSASSDDFGFTPIY
jgi:hypothetical protein